MAKALLIDVVKCVGCGLCYEACKNKHGFPIPDEPETTLSATALTVVQERGDYYVRRLCMHCEDPTCVSVCPVGALQKSKDGPVTYDTTRCIGCRYCMVACPFSVPRYEWSKAAPLMRKCDMCYDLVEQGKQTACAEACPMEATVFGERDELLALARQRMRDNPGDYSDHIYGEHEVGGTSTLFITPANFGDLGFTKANTTEPMPKLTWKVLDKIPSIVAVLGTTLTGIWWITNRREEVRRAEGGDDGNGSASSEQATSEVSDE